MKQNKNILRAALLLLLVIAAPGARAQQLITANADGTYTITMPDHNVTVTADVKKLLTHKDISVTIPSQEWTGSELAPVITVTDDETPLALTTDYTVTAPSGTIQDASDYTFTINGAGNYSGETTATFTITPKPVTVKANDMTKVIGEADPTLTATVTGLVDGYDITYDLSRETGEEAGTYIITPSGATAQGNYTVTYLTGTMTIAMPTQVSIALTGEYGTYCSDYDLDFSGATGLTAYIAAGYNKTEHTLLMVKVTSVPAGTGLLLKGTAGSTYTAKGQTSPYVYSNLLTGTIAETDVTTNDLILGKSEIDNAIGFYRVRESGTLAAGKAYLKDMAPAAGARMLSLEFYDDATGIADVRSKMSDAVTEDWYSLDGRKWQGRPTKKGLYLLNGKKVVVR